jgi:hypothetical protein
LLGLALLAAGACSAGDDDTGGLPAGGDETVLEEGATASAGDATTVLSTASDLEVTADAFAPEGAYVGAEVQVCGDDADVALPWTARTADDEVEPTPLPPGALAGEHPTLDQTAGVGADGCAEGWLVWDLSEGDAVVRWDGAPTSGWLLPGG